MTVTLLSIVGEFPYSQSSIVLLISFFFALVRLGKLVSFWTESVYSPKEICVWQIVSTQRFVTDKLVSGKPSKCLQLYTPLWILLLSVFRSIVLVKHKIFSFGSESLWCFLKQNEKKKCKFQLPSKHWASAQKVTEHLTQKTAEKPVSNGIVQWLSPNQPKRFSPSRYRVLDLLLTPALWCHNTHNLLGHFPFYVFLT